MICFGRRRYIGPGREEVSMVRQNSQVDVCVILLLSLLVTACGDDNDSPTRECRAQPEHPHRIQLDGSLRPLASKRGWRRP